MEEQDVTAVIAKSVEYAQVLDATFEDQNPVLLGSVARELWETVSPLHDVLEKGPKPWRNASGGAWIAMQSAASIAEQLALPELDWDRIGAAISFAVSGVEITLEKWNQALERNT
jgi:hypothetical protein